MATMAVLHAKCLSINSPPTHFNPPKPTPTKPVSLLSLQNLPKGLSSSKPPTTLGPSSFTATATAIAGALFSTLSSSDAALAAQQIADIAEGDNRGLALLIPIIPAILWVLYNIFQPALNQLSRMRSLKGVIFGLGLVGGLAAAGLVSTPSASAGEVMMIADVSSSSDSRGLLLLFVVAPAVLWVLYNILQPALNQINRMRLYKHGIGIHLLQRGPNSDAPAKSSAINPKANHISFQIKIDFVKWQCAEMGMIRKKLEDMGINFVNGVIEEGNLEIDQVFFHDPDDNMIEICDCQKLPVLPPSSSCLSKQ
ncbi:putative Photosystem II core complex proteins psbY, chloroplastic [Cocos nucifera]|nr:putative Photosystem II core complex proteins psbY, chloroplastic [Cocos nucifera]